MNWPLVMVVGFIALVFLCLTVRRIMNQVSDHVAYYLPVTSIAKLSHELSTYVLTCTALVEALQRSAERITNAEQQVLDQLSIVEVMSESASEALRAAAHDWVSAYGPEMFESVIRDASRTLSARMERGLAELPAKLGGEYVLLHAMDALDIQVTLEAQYVDAEELRLALIKVLEWQPLKHPTVRSDNDLREHFISKTRSKRELDLMLGKLGEHLQSLRWKGALALKVREVNCA